MTMTTSCDDVTSSRRIIATQRR